MDVYFKTSLFFIPLCYADRPDSPRGICGLVLGIPAFQTQLSHNFSLTSRAPLTLNPQNVLLMTVSSHDISFAIDKRPMCPQVTQKYIVQMEMKESQNKYECLGTEPTCEFNYTVCLK